MLNLKSFLAVDFGAGSVKLAEFEVNEAGGLRLMQYGIESLGSEGAQESTRAAAILKALQKLLAGKGVKSKDVNVCAAGFQVFSKFVKLPPVEASKVTQMIQYEAQQNVPFPLAEVVWDYQIMGALPSGELEVLLVAIKADVVEGLFKVAEAAGLRLQVADVSPAALCNAFRYNYGDLEDCTMLLDIGAKTSNLLFFEKGKVFSRSINIGANSITQDFSAEGKLPFAEAEKLKIAEGFVSLGGAYAEPENPHQAAISKIARQFMTRLHIQVNQTMQFYRGQQGGSAPVRLFLSGGASIMPYTAQFFAEKLNVPVEYFNPLRNVQLDSGLNLEELARVAHSLGEVVGLGLRNLAHCPVELNLMPESTLRWQSFNQKKPYLIATVFSLVLVVFASGWLFGKLAEVKQDEITKLGDGKDGIPALQARAEKFRKAYHQDLAKARSQANQVADWIEARFFWVDTCRAMRAAFIAAEAKTKVKIGKDTGVWIESMMVANGEQPGVAAAVPVGVPRSMGFRRMPPGMPPEAGMVPEPGMPPDPGMSPPMEVAHAPATGAGQDQMIITLNCRAVSLNSEEANKNLAYTLLGELEANPLFESAKTQETKSDDATGTFTFAVALKLKTPPKF